MSDKTRYFMRSDGMQVVADNDPDESWYEHKAATEVQVVPLDAIVIRREELPQVEERHEPAGPYLYAAGVWAQDDGYETGMERAVAQVAIALFRKEHPPVDEAQVEALADILKRAGMGNGSWRGYAETLVRAGVRVEVQ